MGYGKVSRWAGFSWFILWHVEGVRRTDYADGTDGLALKRERDGVAALKILRKSIRKIVKT